MDDTPAPVHEAGMAGPGEEHTRNASRVLLAFGLALWLLTAIVSVWEGLALQSPVSPLHLGVLAGPITQLRNGCFAFGVAAVVLAQVWPVLFGEARGTVALALLLGGALTQLAALSYAAVAGIVAVQFNDPRDDARAALFVRLCAHVLTSAGLAVVCARAFRMLRVRENAR